MRYKPKSTAALHIALGGLPDKMRVEADKNLGVFCAHGGRASEGDGVARKFGDNDATGTESRKHSKSEQGYLGDAHLAENIRHIPDPLVRQSHAMCCRANHTPSASARALR
jgi:hypothetical protein